MRVFITGAAGQLGSDLVSEFERDGHHDVIAASHEHLDVARPRRGARPDHRRPARRGGPPGRVDRGRRVRRAIRIAPTRSTCLGTRHVAEGARRVGAPVFYVSTDYVFDGTKAEPYVEWDEPRPAVGVRTLEAGGRTRARRGSTDRAHVVGVRVPRRQHGQDHPAARGRARHVELRRRPARAIRPSPTISPSRSSDSSSSAAPACSTSRTRVRCRGSSSRRRCCASPDRTPSVCGPSAPPTSTRLGPRRGPPTRCSTTRRCGSPASIRSTTSGCRSSGWSVGSPTD